MLTNDEKELLNELVPYAKKKAPLPHPLPKKGFILMMPSIKKEKSLK